MACAAAKVSSSGGYKYKYRSSGCYAPRTRPLGELMPHLTKKARKVSRLKLHPIVRAIAVAQPQKLKMSAFISYAVKCLECGCMLTEYEVRDGFDQEDPFDFKTTCPECGHRFLAYFCVQLKFAELMEERIIWLCENQLQSAVTQWFEEHGKQGFHALRLAEEKPEILWNTFVYYDSLENGLCEMLPDVDWSNLAEESFQEVKAFASKMKVTDLKEVLKAMGHPVSGNKAQLLARFWHSYGLELDNNNDNEDDKEKGKGKENANKKNNKQKKQVDNKKDTKANNDNVHNEETGVIVISDDSEEENNGEKLPVQIEKKAVEEVEKDDTNVNVDLMDEKLIAKLVKNYFSSSVQEVPKNATLQDKLASSFLHERDATNRMDAMHQGKFTIKVNSRKDKRPNLTVVYKPQGVKQEIVEKVPLLSQEELKTVVGEILRKKGTTRRPATFNSLQASHFAAQSSEVFWNCVHSFGSLDNKISMWPQLNQGQQ
jgi:hypothetical protein